MRIIFFFDLRSGELSRAIELDEIAGKGTKKRAEKLSHADMPSCCVEAQEMCIRQQKSSSRVFQVYR